MTPDQELRYAELRRRYLRLRLSGLRVVRGGSDQPDWERLRSTPQRPRNAPYAKAAFPAGYRTASEEFTPRRPRNARYATAAFPAGYRTASEEY